MTIKESMYSVKELYNGIYNRVGVPIVFDYHHHRFCNGGLSEREALELAMSTWPEGITPCFHYSESRSEEKRRSKDKSTSTLLTMSIRRSKLTVMN